MPRIVERNTKRLQIFNDLILHVCTNVCTIFKYE